MGKSTPSTERKIARAIKGKAKEKAKDVARKNLPKVIAKRI